MAWQPISKIRSMRVNRVTIIIGDRGTGKTTWLKGSPPLNIEGAIQKILIQNPNRRFLVLDTFDNPVWRDYPIIQPEEITNFNGIKRLYSGETDKLQTFISKYAYSCVLIFEDATKFIGSKLNRDTRQFILDSKQKDLDIFFVFHYMMAVPNDLSRVSDWVILFKTNEIFNGQIRAKFPNPNIEEAYNRVKAHKNRYHFEAVEISG